MSTHWYDGVMGSGASMTNAPLSEASWVDGIPWRHCGRQVQLAFSPNLGLSSGHENNRHQPS